jgi:lycopene beta-cyclase
VAPLIRHRWEHWRFSGENFSTQQAAAGRQYCYVAAEDFFRQATATIATNSYLELWRGHSVIKSESHRNGFLITLADGSSLIAGQVIDTRPAPATDEQQAKLWQIFYGYEIKTRHAVFDTNTVGLMEHLTGNATATQFFYILPFSATHALVELTHFARNRYAPAELIPALEHYLKQWGDYSILRREQAALPMGLSREISSSLKDYHYAGTSAGAIRPATGYAFIRIQQWATRAAKALIDGRQLPHANTSSLAVSAMDSIFLRVLHDQPALGAQFFQALAEQVPGSAMVRFLMDEAGIADYWHIIRALPALRFLMYSFGLNRLIYPAEIDTPSGSMKS